MRLQTAATLFCAWALAGIGSAFGQRAFANEFDLSKPVHLEGKITRLEWANSHVSVDLAVPDAKGGTATWKVELSSPTNLISAGLTRNMLRTGDAVAVNGFVAMSGTQRVGSSSIVVKNAGIAVTIPPADWHHSYAELYDATRTAQMTGRFLSIDWIPHPLFHFAVAMPDGSTQEWLAELPLLPTLVRQGWKQTTLNPGDEIQIGGAVAKDGSRQLFAHNIKLIAAGGAPLAAPRRLLNGTPSK